MEGGFKDRKTVIFVPDAPVSLSRMLCKESGNMQFILAFSSGALDYFEKDTQKALSAIAESDVIYFTGGLPDKMVERIADYGIMEALSAYKGVVMGFSAGAMIQLDAYHITPDEDYPAYCECRGIGYVKQMDVEVHFDGSEAQQRGIDQALRSFGHKVYAIAEDGLVLVQDGNVECIGNVTVYGG